MVATKEGRDFVSSIIKLADVGSEPTVRQGMKTTNVAGYPIFMTWARWGGSEVNASGNTKAFLFLPYLPLGQMPLQKFNGVSSIETPLNMVMSEVPNPYNCKLSITPSLNTSKLLEGEYYSLVLVLKPAAVGNGNNPTPYWDGYIKAVGINPSDVFKDCFSLFATTKTQWSKLKVTHDREDEDYEVDAAINSDSQQ